MSAEELKTIGRWRKKIVEVCVQEMTHLALVNNLLTSLGGACHFTRTEFPIRSGLFPDDFVMQLAPFHARTLDHFIFLERPEGEAAPEVEGPTPEIACERMTVDRRLMTHVGNYKTVGELYGAVVNGVERLLTKNLSEAELFCGDFALQLGTSDVQLEGLRTIRNAQDVRAAVAAIVEQGEGAKNKSGSHYEAFQNIAEEYRDLLRANPEFRPERNVVTNPAMRIPAHDVSRILIQGDRASEETLDFCNAAYGFMLQCLIQMYSKKDRSAAGRAALMQIAFGMMHVLGQSCSFLTTLPAGPGSPDFNAGVSFDLNRTLTAFDVSVEQALMHERIGKLHRVAGKFAQANDSEMMHIFQGVSVQLMNLTSKISII